MKRGHQHHGESILLPFEGGTSKVLLSLCVRAIFLVATAEMRRLVDSTRKPKRTHAQMLFLLLVYATYEQK